MNGHFWKIKLGARSAGGWGRACLQAIEPPSLLPTPSTLFLHAILHTIDITSEARIRVLLNNGSPPQRYENQSRENRYLGCHRGHPSSSQTVIGRLSATEICGRSGVGCLGHEQSEFPYEHSDITHRNNATESKVERGGL